MDRDSAPPQPAGAVPLHGRLHRSAFEPRRFAEGRRPAERQVAHVLLIFVRSGYRGNGTCDCGKCVCEDGWYGEACQYRDNCDLSQRMSKELCRNPQGVICSNAGECRFLQP
ncbi:hypothetical protein Z043_120215 [Scleropages formosus]|uniref:Epidermal growth factor-like domain-containing protein n=1 Tax=Scleropages formosus TaxID=113540 RepID=A0A0P7Y7L9_SCLFO|nr:hypothetical protein Z043_120215 [Scleropages formosus]